MKFASLRKLLSPLKNTPLHPQWLIYRHEQAGLLDIGNTVRGRVLDIGAGHQQVRHYLPEDAMYIGLDYYETAVNWYESRPALFADGQQLPLADQSVDSVLLLDVMEHLPDPEQCVAEIRRVLKPGGSTVIQVPFMYPVHDAPLDFQRWTVHGLRRLADKYHFNIITEKMMGTPIETAVQLHNLAICQTVLHWVKGKNPLAVTVLLLPFIILFANLYAWISSRLPQHRDEFMPQSIRVEWARPP